MMLATDDKVLSNMFQEQERSDPLYRPSNFWNQLTKLQMKQLTKGGFGNFKRTINMRYFNWGALGILGNGLTPILYSLRKGNLSPMLASQFPEYSSKNKYLTSFNVLSAFIYKIHLSALYEYVKPYDRLNLLGKLVEPKLGNPFLVIYKGKLVSQDLSNSIFDFYRIKTFADLLQTPKIVEIGAGYGRLAYVFLKAIPNTTYTIVDIPPALFVAQKYLSELFPDLRFFKFRKFDNYNEIKKEFESASIRFLTPSQLSLLPSKSQDLVISISTLHEMTREQIRFYLSEIDRLSRGYFYTKQLKKSWVKDNQNITQGEYPVPRKWKVIHEKTHPIQRFFFEALYRVL